MRVVSTEGVKIVVYPLATFNVNHWLINQKALDFLIGRKYLKKALVTFPSLQTLLGTVSFDT